MLGRFALAMMLASPAAAHDLWVQPDRFNVAAGADVPLTIQVGHGTDRARWGGARGRVVRFDQTGPRGTSDARGGLTLQGPAADAVLRFMPAGTHVVALVTNHASSDLPALRFNDYAKAEGLTPILAARERAGLSRTAGREIYSRRAKALVQVGATPTRVDRPLGLTLEIVPQINPYALGPGAPLPLIVLYEGKPLGGALVKLVNLDFDAKPLAERRTDATGGVAFEVPRQGRWQLNVVWSKAITGNSAADFDTTFSSLTFGFR